MPVLSFHTYVGSGVVPGFVGVAVKTTLSFGQMLLLSAASATDAVTFGFTVMVTELVAIFGTAQPKLLVSSTVITSPFTRLELEYVVVVDKVPATTDDVHL